MKELTEELFNKETKIEVHFETILKKADQNSLYHQLKTIPGIGENLACRITAEIGDVSRFENHKMLVAYAGIDPKVYQSRQVTGAYLSITKKVIST